ncbi:MAG: TlpA disulfide reductase family protein [Opitutaceae bacterium]
MQPTTNPSISSSRPNTLWLRVIAALVVFLMPVLSLSTSGRDEVEPAPEEVSEVSLKLNDLVARIIEKLRAGQRTELELADELAEFDALLDEYGDQKTDDVAQVLVMKGTLYSEVMDNPEKAIEAFTQLRDEFPETQAGTTASAQIAGLEAQQQYSVGKVFPGFSVQGLDGEPLALDDFRGKVVLLDFWATWCQPCLIELPNVIQAYQDFHADGFEIIGISLDSSRERLEGFIESNQMVWPQYFDGKGWMNALAQKYAVQSIPATYLLDGEGVIIAKNLRGPALVKTVADALESNRAAPF